MRTEVVMPQMGESVTEGTITRWLVEVGERVERDEPLFELTTDKVDADVPSPVEGVLVEKRAEVGDTVEINTVVAIVDTEGEEGAAATDEAPTASPDPSQTDVGTPQMPEGAGSAEPDEEVAPSTSQRSGPSTGPGAGDLHTPPSEFTDVDELRRVRSTPLVRRIAEEHGIDSLAPIEGSGLGGRVTKRDILDYIDSGAHRARQPAAADQRPAPRSGAAATPAPSRAERAAAGPALEVGPRDRVETMSPQRQAIAEHMIRSRATSAHAHTIHEVDFSAVVAARRTLKAEYAERGVRLTYTAFMVRAVAEALAEFPVVNSSLDGDQIIYRGGIHVGVAVALDNSLIVPVVRDADELSLLGVARKVGDLAERARNKRLDPSEVQGGTFTVSNHGVFGPEFGIPVINQPQVAVMSTGAIKKRVVVDQQTDGIVVRPTSIFCLSFDHRVIDGATADRFMARIREILEGWSD